MVGKLFHNAPGTIMAQQDMWPTTIYKGTPRTIIALLIWPSERAMFAQEIFPANNYLNCIRYWDLTKQISVKADFRDIGTTLVYTY